ncbi:hypothetical protein [Streptomyces prasinus]|uniref:hypothetical protein n=1 Tax=Streptomyces prasinus TaxID=67345 RepID=UPI0036BDEC64
MDLVLEVDDVEAVTGAALARIADDDDLSAEERMPAQGAVAADAAEALAYLVDPFGLVGDVPGVELQQASWSSERIDYDPDSPEWDLDEEGEEFYGDGFDGAPGDTSDGVPGGRSDGVPGGRSDGGPDDEADGLSGKAAK